MPDIPIVLPMNPHIPPHHRQAAACFAALIKIGVSLPVARAIAKAYLPALPVRRSAAFGSYNRITCGLN